MIDKDGASGILAESPTKNPGSGGEKNLELIDTRITTHHIKNEKSKIIETFFVMSGFKKGMQMASGKYA